MPIFGVDEKWKEECEMHREEWKNLYDQLEGLERLCKDVRDKSDGNHLNGTNFGVLSETMRRIRSFFYHIGEDPECITYMPTPSSKLESFISTHREKLRENIQRQEMKYIARKEAEKVCNEEKEE